ncbi:hypothetical protein P691DRAFT_803958 [Macrolepiota fuliginosa MF-IS2]|uniref:Uncharacterized protein n=1 Tax=Macrolepiota fuliginosa MF-IS2 TaxID=1400762 RepID=A0A9P6C0B9_9AGAR|nr:hypothetical protein P691DRAFT_803958 [Macrolepiota fuliginosa MF-IS2]
MIGSTDSGDRSRKLSIKTPPLHIPHAMDLATPSPIVEDAKCIKPTDPSPLVIEIPEWNRMDLEEIAPLDRFELEYPDESPMQTPSSVDANVHEPPTTASCEGTPFFAKQQQLTRPSPTALSILEPPLQTPHLELDPSPVTQAPRHQHEAPAPLWNSQPLRLPFKPLSIDNPSRNYNVRICLVKGCTGLIVPSSTCSRCISCVMASWKARKTKGLSLPKRPWHSPVSILRTEASEKGKGKSVSWADQETTTTEDPPPRTPSDNWISRIKRVRLKLPEPPPSPPIGNSSLNTGPPNVRCIRMKLSNLEGTPSPAPDDDPSEAPAGSDRSQTIPYETFTNSLLGDSDLSELTDTSLEDSDSEGDGSESESSSSEGNNISVSERNAVLPKLIIRIPARPSPAVVTTSKVSPPHTPEDEIPYAQCSKSDCGRYLPLNRDGDLCTWCHTKQKRHNERKAQHENAQRVACAPIDENQEPRSKVAMILTKPPPIIDLINRELLSRDAITGARICTPCQHIMPPRSEYPFDACYSCRIKSRRQRVKKAKQLGLDTSLDSSDDEETTGAALAEENFVSGPHPGRCRSRDCGVVTRGPAECWQCASRRIGAKRKRGMTRGDAGVADPGKASSTPTGSSPGPPSCIERIPNRPLPLFTPYPEYRCQHELLADFHLRISGFLEVQTIHSLYKLRGTPEMSVFGFDGQFSVVTSDLDLVSRRESIESGVVKLKGELERLGTLHFNADKDVTVNESGIFTRFLCVHRIYNPFGPPYPEQVPKIMHGELEIAILPDHSHHILPGQKTVVRFRLIG